MRALLLFALLFAAAFGVGTAQAGTAPLTKFTWIIATTDVNGGALTSPVSATRIEKVTCAAPNTVLATFNVTAPATTYEYTLPVAGQHCWWARTVLADGRTSDPSIMLTKNIVLPLPQSPGGWSVE